jgi:hypothetical protein
MCCCTKAVEVVSKPKITSGGEAQADSKVQNNGRVGVFREAGNPAIGCQTGS